MVMAAQKTVRWGWAPTPSCAIDDDCTDADWDTGDDPDEHLYYCQDGNYNTTSLVDSYDGAVVERYQYDPYGKVTIYDDDWSDTVAWADSKKNEILYCGYRYDHESRLYHVRHRSYHPTLGRWMQRDRIGYADGMSMYEYCKSTPLEGLDPLGLSGWLPFFKHLPDLMGPDPPGPGEMDAPVFGKRLLAHIHFEYRYERDPGRCDKVTEGDRSTRVTFLNVREHSPKPTGKKPGYFCSGYIIKERKVHADVETEAVRCVCEGFHFDESGEWSPTCCYWQTYSSSTEANVLVEYESWLWTTWLEVKRIRYGADQWPPGFGRT